MLTDGFGLTLKKLDKPNIFEVLVDSNWKYFGLKRDGKLTYETRDWDISKF